MQKTYCKHFDNRNYRNVCNVSFVTFRKHTKAMTFGFAGQDLTNTVDSFDELNLNRNSHLKINKSLPHLVCKL